MRFVAPTSPLGRTGAALVVTALLATVQLTLVSGHVGPDLCRFAGNICVGPQAVTGGRVLTGRWVATNSAVSPERSATEAHRSQALRAVAFGVRTRAHARRVPSRNARNHATKKRHDHAHKAHKAHKHSDPRG